MITIYCVIFTTGSVLIAFHLHFCALTSDPNVSTDLKIKWQNLKFNFIIVGIRSFDHFDRSNILFPMFSNNNVFKME